MGIRLKILLAFILCFGLMAGISLTLLQQSMRESYEAIERNDIVDHMVRVEQSIAASAASLKHQTRDWAVWDEMYRYALDPDPVWVKGNIGQDALAPADLSMVMIYAKNGNLLTASAIDSPGMELDVLKSQLGPYLQRTKVNAQAANCGLAKLQPGLMLVCWAGIVPSDGQGEAVGTVLMGRLLDTARVTRLRQQTKLTFELDENVTEIPAELVQWPGSPLAGAIGGRSFRASASPDYYRLFYPVQDILKRTVGVVRLEIPRTVHKQGLLLYQQVRQQLVWTVLVMTVLLGLALHFTLIRRLRRFARQIDILQDESTWGTGTPRTLLQQAPPGGRDEIDQLMSGFNRLLVMLMQREEALKKSESKLSVILESVDACIYLKDTQGRYLYANRQMRELFDVSMENIVGKSDEQFFDADTVRDLRNNDRLVLVEGKTIKTEETIHALGAEHVATYLSVKLPLFNEMGEIYALCGISTDITERKQAEAKLYLAASVFTHSREAIMITDPDGRIIDVNGAFTHITGYDREEALGQTPRLLNSGRQGPEFYNAMWHDLTEKGYWSGEIWNRRKNGEEYAELQTISSLCDAQGKPTQYLALFTDITSHKEHQTQLEHFAHYDALTGLPNRVLLADRLHQSMAQAQRRGQLLAVAYLDLDGFKAINDNHGHDAGDELLITVANRMKQALRKGDTLARLGGDEFVAVLLDFEDTTASMPLLTRLLAATAQPVQIGGQMLQVSASLGITFYPQNEEVDADQLLRQADQAMYQAKLAGKNRYHLFDAEHDRSVRGHHESVGRIQHALAENEFELYYQPKVNMRTGTFVGVEALIRWQHPERGLLMPMVFLAVIEDHPLAVELGEWVINTALNQISEWRSAGLDIPVSVNVGARQLQQPDFVERLRAMLQAHPDVGPGELELEVLETSALEDLDQVARIIEACREIGVNFALDDFGTGYSSLTYLKRLPVTQLKIDQSFVRDMLDDPEDMAILQGVIGLSAAFRRQVIAEGVETVEHGEMLLQLGCELAQGYGIASPMLPANIPAWQARWRPDPAWLGLTRVHSSDLPLLFASTEHRAWINALKNHLMNAQELPPLGHRQCQFGKWLEAEGRLQYGTKPCFQRIESLHRQVHELAVELCELHARDIPRSLARIDELNTLRDALLGQLKALGREMCHNDAWLEVKQSQRIGG